MKTTAFPKWSPAIPIRKPDNIISSKAREKNLLGFKPSYENVDLVDIFILFLFKVTFQDPKEHMGLLMSNEYMRIWFSERAVFEKDTYTREKIIKEENKIKRRFVQRMMTYRKPTKNHFIEESIAKRKAASGLPSNQDSKAIRYEKIKYKTNCQPSDHVKNNVKKGQRGTEKSKNNAQNSELPGTGKAISPKGRNDEKSNVLEAEIVCGCCPCPCE